MCGSIANEQRYRFFNPSKLRWIAFNLRYESPDTS